jgi:hypothetical protein
MLITCCFLVASSLTLQVIQQRTIAKGATLGVLLGLAVWLKGVFIAFSLIFLLVIFVDCLLKRSGWRALFAAIAVYVPLLACYACALSWSYGQFTLGVTGELNYAFHVNHLPHWTNWQGGPAALGAPLHPTRQLLPGLPVFEFGTPFQTTYPPYNNLAYWYQGFTHVFSPMAQVAALYRSLFSLARIAYHHPMLIAVVLAFLASLCNGAWRRAVWSAAKTGWPLFVPALLGLGAYVAVHVEDRYISCFVLVLGLLPLAPLMERGLERKRALAAVAIAILTVGALGEIAYVDGAAARSAIRGADFHDDPQWRVATALSAHGLKAGDPVAVIRGSEPPYRIHWAYVAGVRIVSEFGAVPWHIDPDVRMKSDGDAVDPGDVNYGRMFWVELTPAQRAAVLDAFRSTGARAVISLSSPDGTPGPGWTPLKGSDAWIYDFAKQD